MEKIFIAGGTKHTLLKASTPAVTFVKDVRDEIHGLSPGKKYELVIQEIVSGNGDPVLSEAAQLDMDDAFGGDEGEGEE